MTDMSDDGWKLVGATSAFPGETARQGADRWVRDSFAPDRRKVGAFNPRNAHFKLTGGKSLYRIELDRVGAHGWPQYKIYKRIE